MQLCQNFGISGGFEHTHTHTPSVRHWLQVSCEHFTLSFACTCPGEYLSCKMILKYCILKFNQKDATLYNICLLLSVLYMFRAVFQLIIRSSKTVHAALGTSDSPKLAVTAYKFDKYPMLHVQFLSSWWLAEKPLETCRALTTINEYCITLHLVGWA